VVVLELERHIAAEVVAHAGTDGTGRQIGIARGLIQPALSCASPPSSMGSSPVGASAEVSSAGLARRWRASDT
jgi:hypothetical protein